MYFSLPSSRCSLSCFTGGHGSVYARASLGDSFMMAQTRTWCRCDAVRADLPANRDAAQVSPLAGQGPQDSIGLSCVEFGSLLPLSSRGVCVQAPTTVSTRCTTNIRRIGAENEPKKAASCRTPHGAPAFYWRLLSASPETALARGLQTQPNATPRQQSRAPPISG